MIRFETVEMHFRFRRKVGNADYLKQVKWHSQAAFGNRYDLKEMDSSRLWLDIPRQEVDRYGFGQFIYCLDMQRPANIELEMLYPDKKYRQVVHYQAMRRYLFHHWDRPHLAGKTPRAYWGLHAGRDALPSYPWDDEFIAAGAAKRSRKLGLGH